jgi:hypothetical protein
MSHQHKFWLRLVRAISLSDLRVGKAQLKKYLAEFRTFARKDLAVADL